MSDSPIFDTQRRNLGQRRFDEHMTHNARMHTELMVLNMSVYITPTTGFVDAALDAMKIDARDLRDAADAYALWVEQLADDWRAQRQEATP